MPIEEVKEPFTDEESLSSLESYVREWFTKNFKELTPPQEFSFKLIGERKVLDWIRNGDVKVSVITTEVPSPFAYNLIVLGEADVVLMEDRKKRLLELHEANMNRIGKKEEARA